MLTRALSSLLLCLALSGLFACSPASLEPGDSADDASNRCSNEDCAWIHITLEPTAGSPLENGQVIELQVTIASCIDVPARELRYPGIRAAGEEVAYGKIKNVGNVPASFMDGLSAGETCSFNVELSRADDWDGERARVRAEMSIGSDRTTGKFTSEFVDIRWPSKQR